jgi:hypothetical protein
MHSPITLTTSHIPSTEAAERYGLTGDHIASLCRRKKVKGELAGGRVWIVDEESLKVYLAQTQAQREARNQALSKKIRSEYAVVKSPQPSWRLAGSGTSLALALFIVGSFYASAAPVRDSINDVPWEYMPASVASVSARFYDATFISAAVGYLEFIDAVGDVQAQSYRTMGAAIATALSAENASPQLSPQPIKITSLSLRPGALLGGPKQAFERLAAVAASADIALPEIEKMPESAAAPQAPLAATLKYFPQELSDTLVNGWADMATWYAGVFIAGVNAVGDSQVAAYEQTANAELALSEDLADGYASVVTSIAERFIDGVYTSAGSLAYTYGAVLDTMNESGDTMGAAVAQTIRNAGTGFDVVLEWYMGGNSRVMARTAMVPPGN